MEEMLPAAKLLLSRRASLTFMQDNAGAHGRGRLDGPVYRGTRLNFRSPGFHRNLCLCNRCARRSMAQVLTCWTCLLP